VGSDPYVRRRERRRVERRRVERRVCRRARTRIIRVRRGDGSDAGRSLERAPEAARRAQRGEPLRDPLEAGVRGDVQRGGPVVRARVQEGSERRVRLVHRAPHDELGDFRRAETARRVQQRVSVRRRHDARIDAQTEQTFLIRFYDVVLHEVPVDTCVLDLQRAYERYAYERRA